MLGHTIGPKKKKLLDILPDFFISHCLLELAVHHSKLENSSLCLSGLQVNTVYVLTKVKQCKNASVRGSNQQL